MGYNARNDEIGDIVTRMRREWERSTRQFEARNPVGRDISAPIEMMKDLIIVALASMLVALPLSAFAQRERGPLRLEERRLEKRTPPRPQAFGGRVYHGRLAWRDGRWHHALRNGRDGWWWDVGGFWYFYPEQIEGPPDYVSDVEVAADDVIAAPPPPPPQEPKRAFYYRPGDLKGVPYDTIAECTKIVQQAGGVGVCVYK
jgi:hypothetical protein